VLILQGEPQFPANETEWIVTVATGIFGGAAPFILYLEATRRIPTTTVSQFSTLVPVVALIGGVVFLNDVTTPIQLLGTAIVVVSLSLLARYARAH
jgi:drug/metabolite transporter (DMT)-like permease